MHDHTRAQQRACVPVLTNNTVNTQAVVGSPFPYKVVLHYFWHQFVFNAQTLLLFTLSDFKTVVVPSAIFGLANGLAAPVYSLPTQFTPAQLLVRTALALLWAWLNLLPFAIDNQRRPEAVLEDAVNKPWRAMPTQRLRPQSAKRAMLALYGVAVLASACAFGGGLPQCIALIGLGVCYNELRGADAGFVVRNAINAAGFICYTSGAMDVVTQGALSRSLSGPCLSFSFDFSSSSAASISAILMPLMTATKWFALIALIVFSTIQSQDFYDQVGDAARGRATMPLVLGDQPARIITTVLVIVFSAIAPSFWRVGVVGASGPLVLGGVVAARTFCLRSIPEDKMTFKLWNLWLVAIYVLPLIKARGWP